YCLSHKQDPHPAGASVHPLEPPSHEDRAAAHLAAGRLDAVVLEFAAARRSGLPIPASTYAVLLEVCAICGDLPTATRVLDDMDRLGVPSSDRVNRLLLTSAARSGKSPGEDRSRAIMEVAGRVEARLEPGKSVYAVVAETLLESRDEKFGNAALVLLSRVPGPREENEYIAGLWIRVSDKAPG
ncbi:hypothetical protein BDK51DRAFT_42528, partial [Blyttiomyces helicus]